MPIVAIPLEDLNRRLDTDLSKDALEGYLEQLGCDIEDFTQVRRIQCNDCGTLQELTLQEELPASCPECRSEKDTKELWAELELVDVVRMDLLPVRPDIFDPGGLVRAIRGLLDKETDLAEYPMGDASLEVHVDDSVNAESSYRPHIACAVIRGLSFDDISLRLVMKLQENLHWALGRNRKLASIGVYDLSTIEGPVKYTTVAPDGLTFTPLQPLSDEGQTPQQVLDTHPKGVDYAHLLEGMERYPILMDSKDQVLSTPPIINSHETRVTGKTTDVFIDVTGIVERTVVKTLHTIVTSMIELFPGSKAEHVKMVYSDREELTPSMHTEYFELEVAAASQLIGVDFGSEQCQKLLQQMRHGVASDGPDATHLKVTVPAYRNDIMHQVDLIEDIAMAYGYQNIVRSLVPTMTVAKERPERILANRVRANLNGLGYFEVMSLLLSNAEEQYDLLGLEDPGNSVLVANPASVEQTMLRTSLMPQLLKLFSHNRGQGLPQRLFEVDDIVRMVPGQEEPIEDLHLVAGLLDSEAGFADIKAVADSISHELGLALTYRAVKHPGMIPGRVAELLHNDKPVGLLGEIHPSVLEKLRLTHPLVILEIDLSPLLPA